MPTDDQIAVSADRVAVHFDVQGSGSPALVFVHGWCCDRSYWDGQVPAFAPRHTVVRLDLAGHGASGSERSPWTMPAFGADVAAVVEKLGLQQMVLIGHSMGGSVIVEAARRLPDIVVGVVGVDTWKNLGELRSRQAVAQALAPFRSDFVGATGGFVRKMFGPSADPALVERVALEMSAAPPLIAISALEEVQGSDGELQRGLRAIKAPKTSISAGPSPTDAEAQNYAIEVMRMSGVGHFLMMEDPDRFNRLLAQALQKCVVASIAR